MNQDQTILGHQRLLIGYLAFLPQLYLLNEQDCLLKKLHKENKKRYKAICRSVREDGPYIEAGENDNLIVQKLTANPKALGVFGYSFLIENSDSIQGSYIDGVLPDFDNIAQGEYCLLYTSPSPRD